MTRLLQLFEMARRAKRMGNRNFATSKLGQELEQEINTTDLPEKQLNPGIYNPDGSPQTPPIPYENEFQFEKLYAWIEKLNRKKDQKNESIKPYS